ncbi:AcrR family transcriptional regulator [Paenibacillus amylolyticus]|uniref:AcrR family transcriptional regulator n=1 Tax=Paenibacillus amylolyticus TaxID=1451 RepID=A0AAP5GY10_PAEAM|nr:TetR/AcrR family transcriptional regulator [Paenibacillus amylolyticus]MDR6722222.1 AcrR family transcriptional regulator [Paenibacillus amylolyticus]
MARNKFPEQTLEHILTVSAQLFTEKGYEKTSIQDIIDHLGMSKGAVYHHFKSKEEILDAVMERQFAFAAQMLDQLVENANAISAKDKLVYILEHIVSNQQVHSLDRVLLTQIKNPLFIVKGIQQTVQIDAPIIAAIMREGVTDGSITTGNPEACAEIFLMLINIWINPTLFSRTPEETKERLHFLQHMMHTIGVPIVTNTLIDQIIHQHNEMGAYNYSVKGTHQHTRDAFNEN